MKVQSGIPGSTEDFQSNLGGLPVILSSWVVIIGLGVKSSQPPEMMMDLELRIWGPDLYEVNEHFVKPLTSAAGGMSYALMKHPQGLLCEVFISHAWAEGRELSWVFEGVFGVGRKIISKFRLLKISLGSVYFSKIIESPTESPSHFLDIEQIRTLLT